MHMLKPYMKSVKRSTHAIAHRTAYDRPDDGGGALSFEWSIVPDIDFKAYHVYLNDGPWDELVTDISFEGRIADASESEYTRTVAVATTANGISIVDGTEYYALVVVEYQDGRYGVPSSIAGPLVTSDEEPTPPVWATATPFQEGEEGEQIKKERTGGNKHPRNT